MSSYRRNAVILIVVGIVLLANPLYLYPDGGGTERTYEVTTLTDESVAEDVLLDSDRVLRCPGERACVLEERILEEGTVESEYVVERNLRYDIVGHVTAGESTWYVPEENATDDGTILTLREVSATEAVEYTAVSLSDPSPEVREGVETGSVTVHGEPVETFEDRRIIEYHGEQYAAVGTRSSTHWTEDGGLLHARLILFASGLVMTVAGLMVFRRNDPEM